MAIPNARAIALALVCGHVDVLGGVVGEVRHRLLDKCLDLPGSNAANGQLLWAWDCSGGENQIWNMEGNELQYAASPNMCLDVPSGDFTAGKALELWECGGWAQQQWYPTLGSLSVDGNLCMAISDLTSGSNGEDIVLWDCSVDMAVAWTLPFASDQTRLTSMLNNQIRRGQQGTFTGGKGLLVRNPLDGYEEMSWQTVPATFWVNDIFTPTQMYVTAVANNVDCPNDGNNGFYNIGSCNADPNDSTQTGGFNYASLAYVIASQMDQVMEDYDNIQSEDWGYGVFYPSDSNGVDMRCHMGDNQADGYNCPGGVIDSSWVFHKVKGNLGAGDFPAGNPYAFPGAGGGTGCHFDQRLKVIDQTDAYHPDTGMNLVSDYNCQCDYGWKTGVEHDWANWVENWIQHATPKTHTEESDPWFVHGKAPNRALDLVSCWVNNPRDMIDLQNQFWWRREDWNNQMAPKANWNKDPASHRVYWGWNEVPISRTQAADRELRDAVIIRLPGAICLGTGSTDVPDCLTDAAQLWLNRDITSWVDQGHLLLGYDNIGKKPGSDVVFVRAVADEFGNWGQQFFCSYWMSPNAKYQVVHTLPSLTSVGGCYIASGSSVSGKAETRAGATVV